MYTTKDIIAVINALREEYIRNKNENIIAAAQTNDREQESELLTAVSWYMGAVSVLNVLEERVRGRARL